jgi:hypothetical protein
MKATRRIPVLINSPEGTRSLYPILLAALRADIGGRAARKRARNAGNSAIAITVVMAQGLSSATGAGIGARRAPRERHATHLSVGAVLGAITGLRRLEEPTRSTLATARRSVESNAADLIG